MKKTLALCCLIYPLLWSSESAWTPNAEEESLFLNRIADFWQEGEYQIAKSQMKEFLTSFPESSFGGLLCAALGDLYLREKNYSIALEYYAKITDAEILSRIFLNRMQCFYYMEWYAVLADECEAFLAAHAEIESEEQTVYYLAIALYQQCLNAEKDPEVLQKLAMRARPYFERLFASSLNEEVAEAFGHLCCILKDFKKASSIYLDLAAKDAEKEEDMLLQAALIQAEYDQALAVQTLDAVIAKNGGKKQEAIYARWSFALQLQKYDEIIQAKEQILQEMPPREAHLILGRAFFGAKQYSEAIASFQAYLAESPEKSETTHAVFIALMDASFQSENLISLQDAIQKMSALYPQDRSLLQGQFSQALLLKKLGRMEEALRELARLSADEELSPSALLELMHIAHQMSNWGLARDSSLRFLAKNPQEEQALYAWRGLLAASTEMQDKKQLAEDLENALAAHKIAEWQFLLAKTYFDLEMVDKATEVLQHLEEKTAESCFLLALCSQDPAQFCLLAEEALTYPNADAGKIHVALYNVYLELSNTAKARDHLFGAFQENVLIPIDNLLWLGAQYKLAPEKAALLYESILSAEPSPAQFEEGCLQLARLQPLQKAIVLLEKLYALPRGEKWAEVALLLGENYAALGMNDEAVSLFDVILNAKVALRTEVGASACLQSARLHQKNMLEQSLIQLKSLVLQKTLRNEPIHLEAALDYVDLQAGPDGEKKVSLLLKTLDDFAQERDLLAKDYHQARKIFPEKDAIYQAYMQFFEAEILFSQSLLSQDAETQKQLQTKGKDLLLKILEQKAHPALTARAEKCLNR